MAEIKTCSNKRVGKRIKVTATKYLNLSKPFTAEYLREVANQLDNDDIIKMEIKITGWGSQWECWVHRQETQDEIQKRLAKEEKDRVAKEAALRKQKDDIIKQAEKLGMKVIEQCP